MEVCMKATVGIAAVLCSLSGAAYAGSAYVGAGLLEGFADLPSFSGTNVSLSGDRKTDIGYKLYAGYNVTHYLGAEVGFNDLGSQYTVEGFVNGSPFKSGGITAYNYYAALTGTLPLYNEFSFHGELGWVNNTIKVPSICSSAGCIPVSSSSSRSDLLYGIGITYALTSKWAAQFDYANYGKMNMGNQGVGVIKGSSLAVSARYTF